MSKPPVKTMRMCESVSSACTAGAGLLVALSVPFLPHVQVGRIVGVLKENKHQGFPVVDGVEGKDVSIFCL